MIRPYHPEDKEKCLDIFRSNCPLYFDNEELPPFIQWLDHQVDNNIVYKSPTYNDAEKDIYLVVESPEGEIVGCGGFYIVKDQKEARLAWGMIHERFHKKGYGTELYRSRYDMIRKDWPEHVITMGTSQHTFPFYEKMGMKVTDLIKSGYGESLDRYDMTTG